MGLLSSVVGSLTAGNAQGGNGLLDTVMQLIQNQPGGLAGLVQSFQQGGLADVVNSWVSTGQNLPRFRPATGVRAGQRAVAGHCGPTGRCLRAGIGQPG